MSSYTNYSKITLHENTFEYTRYKNEWNFWNITSIIMQLATRHFHTKTDMELKNKDSSVKSRFNLGTKPKLLRTIIAYQSEP